MKFRKATRKDLKEIIKIFMTEYGKKPYNEKWTIERANKRINSYFNGGCIFWVCEEDRKIIGFIIFNRGVYWFGDRRFIEEIVVKEEFQGRGIGIELMKKVEEDFKGKGKKQIYLLSDKASNALKFYKKIGYKESRWVQMEKYI